MSELRLTVVAVTAGVVSLTVLFGTLLFGLGCFTGALSDLGESLAFAYWGVFAIPFVLLIALAISIPAAAGARRPGWTGLRFIGHGALLMAIMVTGGWLGVFPPESGIVVAGLLVSGALAGAAGGAVMWHGYAMKQAEAT